MRYFKSLVAIIALLFATSCTIDNIDNPGVITNDSDVVTVIGRVTRFTDCDVDTRGVKNADEGKITSMAMAIFPLNQDGTAINGNCEYFEYKPNQNELLFTIERGTNYATNTPYAMYIFCNIDMSEFNTTSSLNDMLAKAYKLDNLNIPQNGFPMIGSLGDTFSTNFDRDDQEFILSPTDGGKLTAPKVNDKTQTLLTIPMKALYAKVNFTIEVSPDQTIEGNYSPQFTLDGCTINNAAKIVDFNNTTNSDTDVLAAQGCTITGNNIASGANKINFSFYLPERLLKPTISAEKYKYPFGENGALIEGYSNLREEDKKYAQRFKSKLVEGKAATNIVISGQFRDHQNHYWDVDYTIYLGEDNYGNFDIRRNFEYNNYVTIRGIQTSSDMSDNANGIAIDHRVNVTRTQPAIISLRREVLLDSHFEVRPLRIRQSPQVVDGINAVKVEVLNPGSADDKSGTWWMRLERSFGVGGKGEGQDIYITDGVSAGKRKYFTFDLITGNGTAELGDIAPLTDSKSVVVPLKNQDECVWIYVDECTDAGDGIRAGIIQVTYGNLTDDGKFTETTNSNFPVVKYTINQRKLFKVVYDANKNNKLEESERAYYIEFEEEYLHNFDADDYYGSTEFDGMAWGLPGQQLSYEDDALLVIGSVWDGLVNAVVKNGLNPKYDFYNSAAEAPDDDNAHPYNGYNFCNKIIQVVNGYSGNLNDKPEDNIDVLALNEEPESAVEYCYNKNKRNCNGQVAWTGNTNNLNWYLPAIDEIEEIVTSNYLDPDNAVKPTYARFLEFQNQFYWSSQPAYYVYDWRYKSWLSDTSGQFYIDAINNARATSVAFVNGQYQPSTSGMSDAEIRYYWQTALGSLGLSLTEQNTGKTPVYGDGYDSRTEKNRVRCVRKMN